MSWKRGVLLSSVAAILVTLGVGIYRFTPPAPLWEQDAAAFELAPILDGSQRPVTLGRVESGFAGTMHTQFKLYSPAGPLQIRDIRSGEVVANFLEGHSYIHSSTFSKDKRFFAACGPVKGLISISLVDLIAQKTFTIPLPGKIEERDLAFSRTGKLLVCYKQMYDAKVSRPHFIYDTSNGRLLAELSTFGLLPENGFDDELLLHIASFPSKGQGDEREVQSLEVFHARQGRTIAAIKDLSSVQLAGNGRFVIAKRKELGDPSKAKWVVWNIQNQQIEGEFPGGDESWLTPFSDHRKWLVLADSKCDVITVRELPTCRTVSTCVRDAIPMPSPEEDFVFMNMGFTDFAMRKLPSLELLWEKKVLPASMFRSFGRESRTVLILQPETGVFQSYDTQSGALLGSMALPGVTHETGIQISADRGVVAFHLDEDGPANERSIWMRMLGWIPWMDREGRHALVVIDTENCRERLRLRLSASEFLLSDDGRMLTTLHESADGQRKLCCWDVDGWKPLHGPIGVPAGLGTLFGLYAWWRARRSRKTGCTNAAVL